MTNLTHLPPEILVNIFSFFNKTELGHLKKVSILFRDIAEDDQVQKNAAPPPIDYNQLLSTHTQQIMPDRLTLCMALLSKDKVICGGLNNNKISMIDLHTGICLEEFSGHTNAVSCLVKLPDDRIISGSWDGTLRLWDLKNKRSTALSGHTLWVTCLTMLDENTVVSGSWDRMIRLWDISKMQCLKTFESERGINSITKVTANTFISNACDILTLWDTRLDHPVKKLPQMPAEVNALCKMGNKLIIGMKRNIVIYDLEQEKNLTTLYQENVKCLMPITPNIFVSGADDGTCCIWNIELGICIKKFSMNSQIITFAKLDNSLIGLTNNQLTTWKFAPHTPELTQTTSPLPQRF